MDEKKSGPVIADVAAAADRASDAKLLFTKSFTFEHTVEETGKRYQGVFTCQRLTLGRQSQKGMIKARLSGSEMVDTGTESLNEMIAYCQVAITDAPPWWLPLDFMPEEGVLLRSVYKHVAQWEQNFRSRSVGERIGEAPSGSGGT